MRPSAAGNTAGCALAPAARGIGEQRQQPAPRASFAAIRARNPRAQWSSQAVRGSCGSSRSACVSTCHPGDAIDPIGTGAVMAHHPALLAARRTPSRMAQRDAPAASTAQLAGAALARLNPRATASPRRREASQSARRDGRPPPVTNGRRRLTAIEAWRPRRASSRTASHAPPERTSRPADDAGRSLSTRGVSEGREGFSSRLAAITTAQPEHRRSRRSAMPHRGTLESSTAPVNATCRRSSSSSSRLAADPALIRSTRFASSGYSVPSWVRGCRGSRRRRDAPGCPERLLVTRLEPRRRPYPPLPVSGVAPDLAAAPILSPRRARRRRPAWARPPRRDREWIATGWTSRGPRAFPSDPGHGRLFPASSSVSKGGKGPCPPRPPGRPGRQVCQSRHIAGRPPGRMGICRGRVVIKPSPPGCSRLAEIFPSGPSPSCSLSWSGRDRRAPCSTSTTADQCSAPATAMRITNAGIVGNAFFDKGPRTIRRSSTRSIPGRRC